MTALRLLGYWRGEVEAAKWPEVRDFVDAAWPSATRAMVVDHLVRGRKLQQWRGLSPCRFCGRHNGSQEFTDEEFYWPEGLAHYVSDHDVRLPDEFVRHVEGTQASSVGGPVPGFDHLGQRVRHTVYDLDYDVWLMTSPARDSQFMRTGVKPPSDWLNADIDVGWWMSQVGWARPAHP